MLFPSDDLDYLVVEGYGNSPPAAYAGSTRHPTHTHISIAIVWGGRVSATPKGEL
jgi:hypothetical protein